MKKFLWLIPLIIIFLSACNFQSDFSEDKSPKTEIIQLNSSLVNEYTHHILEFDSQFKLNGTLPRGLNIMPILDQESKLELYGVAGEAGEFVFSLEGSDNNTETYSLRIN